MKNKWLLAVGLALLLGVSACSSGNKKAETATGGSSASMSNTAADYNSAPMSTVSPQAEAYDMGAYDYAEEAEIYEEKDDNAYVISGGSGTAYETPAVQPEKIIRDASLELRTDRFDEAMEELRGTAAMFGGFIESAHLYYQYNGYNNGQSRVLSITLRVPSERFAETLRYAEGIGQVVSSVENAQDVSAQYYDMAGRLETSRIEEERVLEMIGRAVKIDELLALEERLGQIRARIEQYQSKMNAIDRLAAYSTIRVGLQEVTKEELIVVSDNLGTRIQQAFIHSVNSAISFFQNVVIFLAGALIPLVAVGLAGFVVYRIIRATLRNIMKKKSEGKREE